MLDTNEAVVLEEQNSKLVAKLVAEFAFKEFTVTIKQMHPDKSPGPDGLNPTFFKFSGVSLGRKSFSAVRTG